MEREASGQGRGGLIAISDLRSAEGRIRRGELLTSGHGVLLAATGARMMLPGVARLSLVDPRSLLENRERALRKIPFLYLPLPLRF